MDPTIAADPLLRADLDVDPDGFDEWREAWAISAMAASKAARLRGRWLAKAGQLADVLAGGGLQFTGRRRFTRATQGLDASAHAVTVPRWPPPRVSSASMARRRGRRGEHSIAAGAWGLVGASSLVLGALIAFGTDLPPRLRGLILAFGAGTLFGAVAYELIEEAVRSRSPASRSRWASRRARSSSTSAASRSTRWTRWRGDAPLRPRIGRPPLDGPHGRSGLAVVLGAVLDGIPESIVLGVSLIGRAPASASRSSWRSSCRTSRRALSASEDLAQGGMQRGRILTVWIVVAVASGSAAALGYGLLETAAPGVHRADPGRSRRAPSWRCWPRR